jgi:DNA-binding LytR/AlgR family response regulator
VSSSLLQLALRELREVFTSRLSRFGLLIAIFVLAVSGPFGTFQSFNIGQRFAYWAAMVLGCYLTGVGVGSVVVEVLRPRIAERWARVITAGLITGLPVTAMVIGINSIAYQAIEPRGWLNIWIYATLVTLAVFVALTTLNERLRAPQPPATAAAPMAGATPSAPPILERVPLPQRGNLLALIVEDHYVDIVTDRGKALVLMRLVDAMRETGSVAGLQIHRSHWVARDAVVKTYRTDGKVTLELSNGMRLPVSRGYLPAARDAGLA